MAVLRVAVMTSMNANHGPVLQSVPRGKTSAGGIPTMTVLPECRAPAAGAQHSLKAATGGPDVLNAGPALFLASRCRLTKAEEASGTESFDRASFSCEVLAPRMSASKKSACRALMNCFRVNDG